MSKQYAGNKPQEEIKAAVTNWDQTGWDKGDDFINFDYIASDGNRYAILYNGFNGTFMAKVNNEIITECNTELDNEPWYAELLEVLYREE